VHKDFTESKNYYDDFFYRAAMCLRPEYTMLQIINQEYSERLLVTGLNNKYCTSNPHLVNPYEIALLLYQTKINYNTALHC
jgi:hypothetical protein